MQKKSAGTVVLAFFALALFVFGATFIGLKFAHKADTDGGSESPPQTTVPVKPIEDITEPADKGIENDDAKITVILDEWQGWKAVLDANKGINNGKKNSLFAELGVDVNIAVVNDDDEAFNMFVSGEAQAIGLSVNEWAYVKKQYAYEGIEATMVMLTDRSVGGDGIVTTADIYSIEDLVGHKIALAEDSAAHIMLEWLMKNSSLTYEEVVQIRQDMIFKGSTEEAYELFLNGDADVAVLWEPYISLAKQNTGAKELFTTKDASNMMIDGIVFRNDFIAAHPEAVEKFIEGTLRVVETGASHFTYIKEFESYAELPDETIAEMTEIVSYTGFADNSYLFSGTAQTLFEQMGDIWLSLGKSILTAGAESAFAPEYLMSLASKFPDSKIYIPVFTDKDREGIVDKLDTQTLLKQTLTVNFEKDVAIINESSYPALQQFAQTAIILNGAIIQIEGNIADTGLGDTSYGRTLSENRAIAVKDYLVSQGIDENRFICIGNGMSKPLPGIDPKSEEGKEANRRTDIFFMRIE